MGVAAKDIIPFHRLGEHTDDGFQIDRVKHIGNKEVEDAILLGAHRDDHYIFLIHETGSSQIMVDFDLVKMGRSSIFFVLPGQVHRYMESTDGTTGWFLAVDTGLIPERFRLVLEDPLLTKRPLSLSCDEMKLLAQCLELLYSIDRKASASPILRQSAYGLVDSFSAMMASLYADKPASGQPSRLFMITQDFRKLLLREFKVRKSPAEYAASLNLSLSYLNEAVKATTGSSVSNLIQQEVMLEAKRLLYHSNCSVKEIAHELGYDDHTYFSRLFKKTVGATPGDFRRHYRE